MTKKEDTKTIKKRLKNLSKLINEHNIHYHHNDKPLISDREFDKLVIENLNTSALEKIISKIIKNKKYLRKVQNSNFKNVLHKMNFLTSKIDNLKSNYLTKKISLKVKLMLIKSKVRKLCLIIM